MASARVIPAIFLGIFVFLSLESFAIGDVHTLGTKDFLADKLLFQKLLYEKNSSEPTNYTIIFKYEAPGYSSPIGYAEFNVTANSSAKIVRVDELDVNKVKTITATLDVVNATNLKVYGTIRGMSSGLSNIFETESSLRRFLDFPRFKPKSFTLIYEHSNRTSSQRHVRIGERQKDDQLLHKTEKLVTTSGRFAESEMLFEDPIMSITSVEFVFGSPSAIAFFNSSFISEHKLNVIVYDLNRSRFSVSMSVYGYETSKKPDTYRQIV